MSWVVDTGTGLSVEVPDISPLEVTASLTASPVVGHPPAPAAGDLVFISRRARFDGADFIPMKEQRWGTRGLVAPVTGTLNMGIITAVSKSRPGARVDNADSLSVPYSVAVFNAVTDWQISCVFLGTEEPEIGDSLYFARRAPVGSGGQIMRIASVSEQWAEGQFCGAQLSLISPPSGWQSYSPTQVISNLS